MKNNIDKYLSKILKETIDIRNIEKDTVQNDNFRKVLFTGKFIQLVLMSLNPGEEIGNEVHNDTDQFFRIDEGEGKVIANKKEYLIKDGSSIVIPAGTYHNIINSSTTKKLKLYTIYGPPHHKKGLVQKIKPEHNEEDEG